MSKVLCVLYPDPVDGYPTAYARDDLPKLDRYPDGQTLPTPQRIDFTPGALLGSVSGELGLRKFLEGNGHQFVVTSDKDGPGCAFERELPNAEIVISQPFWPAYLTAERIARAPKLKLAVTAGIGSDHVDLEAASKRDITVAEVTFCNSISVAEHAVMQILALVRNYIPSYQWVVRGGWNIADCVERAYDLEGMSVGVVAAGRIGLAVLKRLKPFAVKLHYTQRRRLPAEVEQELDLTFHPDAVSLARVCDIVSLHCPLHPGTRHMINDAVLKGMKRGSYIVNTARAELCDRDAIVRALEGGPRRVCRGRLVPAAAAEGPPLAIDAPPRHDAARVGNDPFGPGALRRRHPRDPRMLVRRPTDPRRVPDRRGRETGRHRSPLVHGPRGAEEPGRRDIAPPTGRRDLRRSCRRRGWGAGGMAAPNDRATRAGYC